MKPNFSQQWKWHHRGGDSTDGEHLLHDAEADEQQKFEELIRRHGIMVWSTCRRILGHDADTDADTEDAFQRVCLALARFAKTHINLHSVSAWLHRVATNAALKFKARRNRTIVLNELQPQQAQNGLDSETAATIHEELGRLPEAYRIAVVMVDLEGYSHGVAARQFGWPVGTLSGRLVRARQHLKHQLERRGIQFVVGSLTGIAASEATIRVACIAQPLHGCIIRQWIPGFALPPEQ
jgi:RNA polymerase sigma factor (sigma-70 family)